MRLTLNVNSQQIDVEVDEEMPLLWVLREQLQLNAAKYSCGAGLCGACTVLVDGKPLRSCVTPVKNMTGKKIVTLEGIAAEHPVKAAWKKLDVPQCGYCQSGQILTAVSLLEHNATPSAQDIDNSMVNLCRCGTYPEIKQAIELSIELNQPLAKQGA